MSCFRGLLSIRDTTVHFKRGPRTSKTFTTEGAKRSISGDIQLKMLKKWLAHPLTRGIPVDDPQTTHLRRRIIQEKPFLRSIYLEWYEQVAKELPPGREGVLELGAGAGFLRQFVRGLIASDVFMCPEIDIVLEAA